MFVQLFIEAFVVGISVVIVGTIISLILKLIIKSDLPKECENWNKYYVMEITLFLIGFLLHILYEALGLNKWYCVEIYSKTKRIV